MRTEIKTKTVKKIIRATIKGGISISPKETKNKRGKEFIKSQTSRYENNTNAN